MPLRIFPYLLLVFQALLLQSCAQTAAPAPTEQARNIIFILTDDQRYDFLSYLDHPWIETPHIDRLAANIKQLDDRLTESVEETGGSRQPK